MNHGVYVGEQATSVSTPVVADSGIPFVVGTAPVQSAEDVLLFAHTASGLPWWGSILLTTVALRGAVTLPLAAYQHYILAKVRGAEPRLDRAYPLPW